MKNNCEEDHDLCCGLTSVFQSWRSPLSLGSFSFGISFFILICSFLAPWSFCSDQATGLMRKILLARPLPAKSKLTIGDFQHFLKSHYLQDSNSAWSYIDKMSWVCNTVEKGHLEVKLMSPKSALFWFHLSHFCLGLWLSSLILIRNIIWTLFCYHKRGMAHGNIVNLCFSKASITPT